ncbi:MAG TPA: hypothetical protein VMJ70_07970 [Candidatus Sulfotelmatobacter sp.]|nr:hypothetical protein [Candidatus Sulfotelmatobacter sp.]
MKSMFLRLLAGSALAVIAWILVAGAAAPSKTHILEPDKLIILSTVDVKGKASPCG